MPGLPQNFMFRTIDVTGLSYLRTRQGNISCWKKFHESKLNPALVTGRVSKTPTLTALLIYSLRRALSSQPLT
jgi:hypothetical protein